RFGAAEPDLASRGVNQVERDQPPEVRPVLRLDRQGGERLRHGGDDPAAWPADGPVAAADLGPDRELRRVSHGCSLPHRESFSYWLPVLNAASNDAVGGGKSNRRR